MTPQHLYAATLGMSLYWLAGWAFFYGAMR